jgi:hypothetical protein
MFIMNATMTKQENTTALSRQLHGKHVSAAMDAHATIKVMLETVPSTRSVQRDYKEDNWSKKIACIYCIYIHVITYKYIVHCKSQTRPLVRDDVLHTQSRNCLTETKIWS